MKGGSPTGQLFDLTGAAICCARPQPGGSRYNGLVAVAPTLLDQVLALTREEREELVRQLIVSLDADDDETGVEEAWDQEIARRSAEVEAGTADTISHEEYKDHVRNRRASGKP
jgi:putative addiction module component (TIGR02574 family)